MTQNWLVFMEANSRYPKTLAEAVNRLALIANQEQRSFLASIEEDELPSLHFCFGYAIRGAFGLRDTNSELLKDCQALNPEDASLLIVKALWKKINEEMTWAEQHYRYS